MGPRPGSLADRLTDRATILVVEDEPDIAAFLGAFFRASGRDVCHVNPRHVNEVVAAVRAALPVCVLLDLCLSGFSGIDVLRSLRDCGPGVSDVPIIVMTADARESTKNAAIAAGATDYVTKPFLVRDLYERVTYHLAGQVEDGRA